MESNQREYHYPGTNYLGPGTQIRRRILTNIKPTSDIDAIARQHDVDYLRDNSDLGMFEADLRAIQKSFTATPSLQQIAMITGLSSRIILSALFGKNLFSGEQSENDAKILQLIIDLDQEEY